MGVLFSILRNWFLIGIVVAIILANLFPTIGAKGGPLKPELSVKYGAVFIIFLNSGLSLKTEDLQRAFFQFKIHIFVQAFTFILFPFIINILVSALEYGPFDHYLLEGLVVLSCMPPPVSSAVILTKAVGGNEAAAIFNSAFGSFLADLVNLLGKGLKDGKDQSHQSQELQGIFVTPALILSLVGSEADVPVSSVISQLFVTVILPLILGQIIRNLYKYSLQRLNIPFGSIGSFLLLLIIYTTFCDTFIHEDISIDTLSLYSIILLILVLQCSFILFVFYLSTRRSLQLKPADTTALLFCCTHKSLTLGIPIIKIIFSGYESISIVSIPLLIYHPTQILLGGLLVPTVRGWLVATQKLRYPHLHSYV